MVLKPVFVVYSIMTAGTNNDRGFRIITRVVVVAIILLSITTLTLTLESIRLSRLLPVRI